MAKTIKGKQDGEGGRNESYRIPGRGSVSRKKLVRETEGGKHSGFSTYEREGEKYVRAKPDSVTKNNVNDYADLEPLTATNRSRGFGASALGTGTAQQGPRSKVERFTHLLQDACPLSPLRRPLGGCVAEAAVPFRS